MTETGPFGTAGVVQSDSARVFHCEQNTADDTIEEPSLGRGMLARPLVSRPRSAIPHQRPPLQNRHGQPHSS